MKHSDCKTRRGSHRGLPKLNAFGRTRHAVAVFWQSTQATVMTEFALIAPLLVTLLLGASEASQAMSAHRQLLRATGIVGDMIVRDPQISKAEINGMFAAAETMLPAIEGQSFKIVATGIQRDPATGDYLVVWSHSKGATADAVGSVFQFDETRSLTGEFYTVLTAKASYVGNFSTLFLGPQTFKKQMEFVPRAGTEVKLTDLCVVPVNSCNKFRMLS